MFVIERFISNIIKEYETHYVTSDGPLCIHKDVRFLEQDHHILFFCIKD
jgi:hypothetical protein